MSARGQARNVSEAFRTLNPFALVRPGDPWFADLERLVPTPHYSISAKLARRLTADPGGFVHVGLLGHAGMGKTTLARNALAKLANDGLTPIYINALEVLDQTSVEFSDVLLVIAEAVIREHAQLGLDVGRRELELVRAWFSDELLTATHREQLVGSIETSASAGLEVPLIAQFAAKIASSLRADTEYRREIRRRAQRDPAELLHRINLLLDAAHDALARRKARLCVVLDNLEKIPLEQVEHAVLGRAEEFNRLRTNSLLFFNPAAEYSPIGKPVSTVFDCVTVPALPVRFPGDGPEVVRPEAIDAVRWLLSHRVVLDGVFEQPDACIHALARWSGGHLRDLLMIARRAAEDAEPKRIRVADIEAAGRWLGGRRTSTLRPEDFARAVDLHRTHRILDTEQDRRMLKNSCVLPYDGTEWWDVHPGVLADELFRTAQRERDAKTGEHG